MLKAMKFTFFLRLNITVTHNLQAMRVTKHVIMLHNNSGYVVDVHLLCIFLFQSRF
jgi:hypothetical protein